MADPTRANKLRHTSQALAPLRHTPPTPGEYDIYPTFPVPPGSIQIGYGSLAAAIAQHDFVCIDGYVGIRWEAVRAALQAELSKLGVSPTWTNVADALLPEATIRALVGPFLGGDDPIFGTRFTGTLADLFQPGALAAVERQGIVYGCGAALVADEDALLVYIDLPKNEVQFRSRAGSVTNLGASSPQPPKQMYKRFYFVDWVALNRHKAAIHTDIDLIVDGQREGTPLWMVGDVFRGALRRMSTNYFRVRPWFEPGAWGGEWMKTHISVLPQDVPNYAWSFELIVPENGLMFGSEGYLLETSFDFLMFQAHEAVLGESAGRFGFEFPIRFDFLDTIDGGNLSLQCHPRPAYIKEHFGESFTQDETYYILDCEPGARVYLGFREGVDPQAFRAALERAVSAGEPVDVERFVRTQPAHRHDLFLIPSGTIHCSGVGSLVLEISATPYIFTFKMYDWLRLDLDGRPRPINIERAFDNLVFARQGRRAHEELVSKPALLERGADWALHHLPTHPEHFYDIHRCEFETEITTRTGGSCHVLSLVEGETVRLETAGGMTKDFNYAETFVIPAAAGSYRLINRSAGPVKVVKAFIKPGT